MDGQVELPLVLETSEDREQYSDHPDLSRILCSARSDVFQPQIYTWDESKAYLMRGW